MHLLTLVKILFCRSFASFNVEKLPRQFVIGVTPTAHTFVSGVSLDVGSK